MTLAVDLDGVLADFNTGFARLLMRIEPQVKVNVHAETFPEEWNWQNSAGFSPVAVEAAWTEVKNSGVFWVALFGYPSAHADVAFLQAHRKTHDIYFITSRPGQTARAESVEWLKMMGYPDAQVIIAWDKQAVCRGMRVDAIVDDRPENLAGLDCQTFLLKRPYNRIYWKTMPFKAVDSVREAFHAL